MTAGLIVIPKFVALQYWEYLRGRKRELNIAGLLGYFIRKASKTDRKSLDPRSSPKILSFQTQYSFLPGELHFLPSLFTYTMFTDTILLILICAPIVWCVYGVLYRLVWSPVAGFPGPKLAALTFWYEFYYDVIKVGQYSFKIKELHKQYGKCSWI